MLQREERQTIKFQQQPIEVDPEVIRLLRNYKDRAFWCGSLVDPDQDKPCFNHTIGLPVKSNIAMPLFDYEEEILDLLKQDKRFLWIKKCIGSGISELFLRWIAYNGICQNARFANTKIFLTCGPREKTAIELINRLKGVLRPLSLKCPDLILDTEKTVCKFANLHVQTIPSDHLDVLRGWTNVSAIISDESDFYSPSQQEILLDIIEAYPAKCPGIYLILISTPNLPGGLFQKIEDDPNSIYHKIFLPYTKCIDRIYSREEIDQARRSQGFERQYNLRYGYGTGTVFLEQQIESAIVEYPEPSNAELSNCVLSIGVDPGFGSSKFAVLVTTILNVKVTVLSANQYERISFSHSIEIVANIMRDYGYYQYSQNIKALVDSSRPDWVRDLKSAVGEDTLFEAVQEYSRKNKIPLGNLMNIIPVSFGEFGKQMLSHLQGIVSDSGLAVAPRFKDLIMQLRIAKIKESGMLDKHTGNNTMDLCDSLMLSAWNVQAKL